MAKQGKKLLLVGIFLILVVLLVGREEDPGIIAQVNENGASELSPRDTAVVDEVPVQRNNTIGNDQRQSSDTSLESWYAKAAPNEVVSPDPVDESHLIDDTEPVVSTDPQVE